MGAHKYLLSFLKYIKENDKPFRPLLVDSADPGFRSRFMQQSIIRFIQNLEITLPEEIEQYVYSYILNGSTRIIVQWIRSDYKASESAICELLFSINRSALINLEINRVLCHYLQQEEKMSVKESSPRRTILLFCKKYLFIIRAYTCN